MFNIYSKYLIFYDSSELASFSGNFPKYLWKTSEKLGTLQSKGFNFVQQVNETFKKLGEISATVNNK